MPERTTDEIPSCNASNSWNILNEENELIHSAQIRRNQKQTKQQIKNYVAGEGKQMRNHHYLIIQAL